MTIPRIMLDLETLATSPNALVLSIGAVEFDPKAGLGREFYCELAPWSDQERAGRRIDPATVSWWCQQSPEARSVLAMKETQITAIQALLNFSGFCENVAAERIKELEMWGYGADFDCVVLGSLYDSFQQRRPWSYSKNRCHRTLINFVKGLVEVPPRTGTHHNALDDAKYQAECAIIALNRLGVR